MQLKERTFTIIDVDKFIKQLIRKSIPIIDYTPMKEHCNADLELKAFMVSEYKCLETEVTQTIQDRFWKSWEYYLDRVFKARQYKDALAEKLDQFSKSYAQLLFLCSAGTEYGVDANEFLSEKYPFPVELEDLMIYEWVESSTSNLKL